MGPPKRDYEGSGTPNKARPRNGDKQPERLMQHHQLPLRDNMGAYLPTRSPSARRLSGEEFDETDSRTSVRDGKMHQPMPVTSTYKKKMKSNFS